MGLIPIEDRSDGGERPTGEEATPGVSARVRQLAARLFGGVFGGIGELLAPTHQAVRGEPRSRSRAPKRDTEETAIRPSGQARLEPGTDRQLPAAPDGPRARERRRAVEAQVRGDTLRVYDPDSRDAYIASDVYERVDR